jgi:alanine-synthesizing transaminase
LQVFSQRLSWDMPANRYTTASSAVRLSPEPCCDLSSSNPTDADLDYPHASIAQAFLRVGDFTYQPEALGLCQAREVIANHYAARNPAVSPRQIVVTASSSESYSYLFKLLSDPGGEILVPRPSYPLFEYLASLEQVRVQPYWLQYDGGWYIDFDDFTARLTPFTRAIVVVSPNNPTGNFLKEDELRRLNEIAARHSIPLIIDAVFEDYPLREALDRASSVRPDSQALTFSLNGLSKLCGMPQVKLGWIVATGPQDQVEQALRRLELIADTYLSVGTPVQLALPALFEVGAGIRRKIHDRVRCNFRALTDLLATSPIHPLYLEAGWSAILRLPQTRPEEDWLLSLLTEQRVIVQPGYYFDMPGEPYSIVSLLTRTSTFIDGVNAMLIASSEARAS